MFWWHICDSLAIDLFSHFDTFNSMFVHVYTIPTEKHSSGLLSCLFNFPFISPMPSTLIPPFSHPFCHVNLDMDPKCLRFLSVAQECTVLPRRGYFFASCCLVKMLACQVSEVSWRMQQTLYGFTRDTKSGTSQRDAKNLQPWNCGIVKDWEVK